MTHNHNADSSDLDAARLLLERLGVTPEDLLGTSAPKPQAPTFADYIPEVAKAVSPGTKRVYGTYWNRIIEHWGDRHLDEPTTLEIQQLAETIRSQVVVRRNARGGRGAAEHLIAAIRCVYNHAVADKVISEADNPAKNATKPRRLASTRRDYPTTGLTRSTTSLPPPAMIRRSTPSSCACTSRQPADAAEHSPSPSATWTPTSA